MNRAMVKLEVGDFVKYTRKDHRLSWDDIFVVGSLHIYGPTGEQVVKLQDILTLKPVTGYFMASYLKKVK